MAKKKTHQHCSGSEPNKARNQGEKYVLRIPKVVTSSPVRDDLYPAYIGP